jgi:hypothetical protein
VASVRGAFQRGGGGGGGGGTNVDLIAVGNDYVQLANWLKPILEAAQANPGLSRPRLDYEPTSPRLSVQIDRDKAASLGVSAQSIGRALETMFGSRQVTTYIKTGQEYDVILQTALDQRRSIEDLNRLQVRTMSGALVPLSTVVTTELRGDTPDRPRVDRLRSVTLTTQLNPGYTVGRRGEVLPGPGRRPSHPRRQRQVGRQAKDYPGSLRRRGHGLRPGPAAGLPGAGRAVRKLDPPGRDHADRAAGGAGRPVRPADHRLDHQHLQPDRPDHPGRHRRQERHPDRRVRQPAARRGAEGEARR